MGNFMKVWTTRDCRTWLIRDKDSLPEFLYLVGVHSVNMILDNSYDKWTCGHCGSYIVGETSCTHCNAPKSSRIRSAEVIVCGYLPYGLILDGLEDGFTLEVIHGVCCRPDVYEPGEVIIRMTGCVVVGKYIPEIDVLGDCEDAALQLMMTIHCEMSFIPDRKVEHD